MAHYVDPQKHNLPLAELVLSHTAKIQSYFKALEMSLFTKCVTYAAKNYPLQIALQTVSILLFPSTLNEALNDSYNNVLGHMGSQTVRFRFDGRRRTVYSEPDTV